MKSNKILLFITIILLVGAIFLLASDKLGFWDKTEANDSPSIDQIVESSVETGEIATNLKDGRYVKVSFTIETNSKKAKAELDKRKFQLKNIIVTELSDMKAEDLEGKEGKRNFEGIIKSKANELMQEGEVIKVYITSYIIS